jgi:hypothetical protein
MFNPVRGSARERIDVTEFQRLRAAGSIVLDQRLTRPLYFDGRFLTARDLTREQTYFLTRQADLGRAGGSGVVAGLGVEQGPTATSVEIGPGHGITPVGELVMVPQTLTLELADVAEIQRLDLAFGLSRIPRAPARGRTGLFVVALRPVEFTANPIASYPTTVDGARTVEDGDIIEAVAVSVIPYPDDGGRNETEDRRSRLARQIFVDGQMRGIASAVLPLAIVSLDRGVVQWVDPYLVRREVGAEQGSVLGMNFAPRAVREAHLLQYVRQLNDVIEQRTRANRGLRFAASEHFLALPAAGTLPSAAINPGDFSQIFFPPQVEVNLSVVATDELGALIDDGLLLNPIDLTAAPEELESTSVLVLATAPRAQMARLAATLGNLTVALRPAAPALLSQRRPIDVLRGLTLLRLLPPVLDTGSVADNAWRQLLSQSPSLWYIRRRNVLVKSEVTGAVTIVNSGDTIREQSLNTQIDALGLRPRFDILMARSSTVARAEIVKRLAAPAVAESPTLLQSAVRDLEASPTLDAAAALTTLEKTDTPGLGEGLKRLEAASADLKTPEVAAVIANSGAAVELDRASRTLDQATLKGLADEIAAEARSGGTDTPAKVATLIRTRLGGTLNARLINQ